LAEIGEVDNHLQLLAYKHRYAHRCRRQYCIILQSHLSRCLCRM